MITTTETTMDINEPRKAPPQNQTVQNIAARRAQPTIEVLISTCNNGIHSAAKVPTAPEEGISYLICHQVFGDVDPASFRETVDKLAARPDIRYIHSATQGVATNRNECFRNAQGDILLFTDDDVMFRPGWTDMIWRNFAQRPDAAGLTFKVLTTEGKPFKPYREKEFQHNSLTVMRICTVEFAARREPLQQAGLEFDERFGINVEYANSEENIFVSDAVAKGLKLYFVPEYLVVHPPMSSGQALDNPRLIASKGALFKRVYGWKGAPLLFAFAIKKWPKYRGAMSPFRFLRLAFSSFGKL